MFDFSNATQSSTEVYEVEKKVDLDMNLLLEKIDTAQYGYFDTLSDHEKKSFQPYVIQRWISSRGSQRSKTNRYYRKNCTAVTCLARN